MINGRREVGAQHRQALRVGDRDQRHVVKTHIKRKQIGQILAAVQGGNGAVCDRPERRKLELVDVEMQNIKFVGALAHAIEHQHIIGDGIRTLASSRSALGPQLTRLAAVIRIAARKQCHVVAQCHQFLSQIGDNSFGAAIKPRRNAFDQRRDLRNSHCASLRIIQKTSLFKFDH